MVFFLMPRETLAERRVVTLVPSLAEIAAEEITEAKAEKEVKVVGVSEYSDRPQSIVQGLKQGTIVSIGPYFKPNFETILTLKPSVVLATRDGTPKALVEQLMAQKVVVTLVSGDRLEDIPESYRKVGGALGLVSEGNSIAEKFARDWKSFLKKVGNEKCRATAAILFYDSSNTSLIVAGPNTFLGDLIDGAGLTNVYAKSGLKDRYPRISKEDLLSRSTELLLVMANESDSEEAIKKFIEWIQWKKPWLAVRDSALQRPTRGLLGPLQKLRAQSCLKLGRPL